MTVRDPSPAIGPLQRHESRFHERNLFVFALLGLLSRARATRRSILQHCSPVSGASASVDEATATPPRSLLLALGVISLARTLERHLNELGAEGSARLPSQGAAPAPRARDLRGLLR